LPRRPIVAVKQSGGRDRLNIHGAIDLQTSQPIIGDVWKVDHVSTIMLLIAIEVTFPAKQLLHALLNNARYHQATLVQERLATQGCRIRLHFVPTWCPHLNPIDR